MHPSLGRLAFLFEPDGVRLHWLTHPTDRGWDRPRPDNAVDEPACRRGPDRLPLKSGAWPRSGLVEFVVLLPINWIFSAKAALSLSPASGMRILLTESERRPACPPLPG